MMLEHLMPLLWRRRGQGCRSPLSCCCGGGGVDDAGAPRAVVVVEVGLMMPEPLKPLLWPSRSAIIRLYILLILVWAVLLRSLESVIVILTKHTIATRF
jgi:hypothetical protein